MEVIVIKSTVPEKGKPLLYLHPEDYKRLDIEGHKKRIDIIDTLKCLQKNFQDSCEHKFVPESDGINIFHKCIICGYIK